MAATILPVFPFLLIEWICLKCTCMSIYYIQPTNIHITIHYMYRLFLINPHSTKRNIINIKKEFHSNECRCCLWICWCVSVSVMFWMNSFLIIFSDIFLIIFLATDEFALIKIWEEKKICIDLNSHFYHCVCVCMSYLLIASNTNGKTILKLCGFLIASFFSQLSALNFI